VKDVSSPVRGAESGFLLADLFPQEDSKERELSSWWKLGEKGEGYRTKREGGEEVLKASPLDFYELSS